MSMGGGGDEVKETAEEREMARIGVERLQRYDEVFKPIENKFIAKQMDQKPTRDAAGREAWMGSTVAFDNIKKRMTQTGNTGRGPGSGAFGMAATDSEEAAAHGLAQVDASNVADKQNVNNLQGIISMGRGQAVDALNGMAASARDAGRKAIDRANAAGARKERYAGMAGLAAGIGTSAYMNRTPTPQSAGGLETYAYNDTPQPTIREY